MGGFEWLVLGGKLVFVLVILLHVTPVMVWLERRGSALMQNRLGPNRIGPLGLFQLIADAIKFIFKEDRAPGHVNKFYHYLTPILAVMPAFMTFAVVPFASTIDIDGHTIRFQLANLDVGILYIFAIASLGVYAIIIAGWSSNNKYALLGSLRSSAQMISYELSMGLSIVGILMVYSSVEGPTSLNLMSVAQAQGEALLQLGPITIPKWGIFVQPLGFILFLTAAYAETNRLPFDLPEGESEIVAGYHLEFGSMKFALIMMAEYVNMTTVSAVVVTLFFGGWQMLPGLPLLLAASGLEGMAYEWARVGFEFISFAAKVAFFMWLFVWVRWTLPRFRYDQLMALGWKVMLPLALVNVVATTFLIYFGVI